MLLWYPWFLEYLPAFCPFSFILRPTLLQNPWIFHLSTPREAASNKYVWKRKAFSYLKGNMQNIFAGNECQGSVFPHGCSFTAPFSRLNVLLCDFPLFPPRKSFYFDELFHCTADSHLLNTHLFPVSCPCYPFLMTAGWLQRFCPAVWSRQGWHSQAGVFFSDSSSQWRAKLSLVSLHGRVLSWWLML